MSVFSERSPLPTLVVNTVNNGVLGAEILDKRVVREGMFREVEASLFMSMETAVAMRDWLSGRIEEAIQLNKMAQAAAKGS